MLLAFLRCFHHIDSLPFKLNMETLDFMFVEQLCTWKYFLILKIPTSTCCLDLTSPSNVGGFALRNYPCKLSLKGFIFLCLLENVLEYSMTYRNLMTHQEENLIRTAYMICLVRASLNHETFHANVPLSCSYASQHCWDQIHG